jgi:hypothetical protein
LVTPSKLAVSVISTRVVGEVTPSSVVMGRAAGASLSVWGMGGSDATFSLEVVALSSACGIDDAG